MSYTQDISRALKSGHRGGVFDQAFHEVLARTEPALEKLRALYASRTLPLLRLPERTSDYPELKKAAAKLKKASDVVFLGTGGSSLGGQALCQLADYAVPGLGVLRGKPRLHFFDNLDPKTFEAALKKLPLKTTQFVAISKSGGTGETLMQTIAAIAALKKAGRGKRIKDHILGLSEPVQPGKKNGLRTLLEDFGCELLEHDTGVGGRFSALTNVGLLPAAVLGLDVKKIRQGAGEALAPLLTQRSAKEIPFALGAALSVAASAEGKTIQVLQAYADRFERFTRWWVQLWAESLGKNGKGTTPVAALGPVDQHSQLQLWLAGPRDKLFSILTLDAANTGPRIDKKLAAVAGEKDFGGKKIGDLVAAQGRATADTLAKNGCPVRTFHVAKCDERALGGLMMHFMLETIVAAHLLGVDPFDQPAVEEGKVLAKRYLAEAKA
ncbi:MAG TPA: glucose-6-phosphate isomerase [Xanthobacteraceae bacterium]|nr:glucose-6-phosphate isomerase [Xanthobacteraceae bacterium]